MSISRRLFLAGTAAAAARPALGAVPASGDVDVAIIGAGAAGVAAARRVIAANRRFALIEASDVVGGRCRTNTSIFGVPYDLGAHWIHMPDINPIAKLAKQVGIATYPAPVANADWLLVAADQALYEAKAAGRNCVRVMESNQFTPAVYRTDD